MTRQPWGHVSRSCKRCGNVGPRVQAFGGWVHFYCLSDAEKRERRAEARKAREAATAKPQGHST